VPLHGAVRIATARRDVAMRLWNGRLPKREPAELVKELYAEENRASRSPRARRT